MIEAAIARRYARALFELGKETGKADPLLSGLDSFYQLCRQVPPLLETLSNRFMDLTARLRIIDELMLKTNSDPLIGNFLKVLVKKGRVRHLGLMVEALRKLVYDLEGKKEAVITTAHPLDDSLYAEIEKILSKLTGKIIMAKKRINPDVLGGVAVQIGGTIYDGTLRASLEKLSEGMKKGA